MTKSIAIKSAFSCGGKAWDYLEHISCKNVVLIRDSQMSQGVSNIVSKIRTYMDSMGVIMGWELLSSNTNVPISYALFKEFVHKWNFESLAKNESLQWNS